MIVGNDYYILVTNNNGLTLNTTANAAAEDLFIVNVYRYEDKFMQNAIDSASTTGPNNSLNIPLSDGAYRISVTTKCVEGACTDTKDYYGTDVYTFKINNELFALMIEKLKDYLCSCKNCNDRKLNRCDDCKEESDCKNDFTFLIMLLGYFFGMVNEEDLEDFDVYITKALDNYYTQMSLNILDAFRKAFVRGHYELAYDIDYIFLVALYVFWVSRYTLLYPDSNITEIEFATTNSIGSYFNQVFDFSKIEQCTVNKGVDIYGMLKAYRDNLDAGYVGRGDSGLCEGDDDTTSCSYLLSLITNNSMNLKRSQVQDISITFGSTNEKIVLMFPISWGNVVRIYDNTRGDITNEFTVKCVDGYIAYVSNDVYNNITVRLNISFDI